MNIILMNILEPTKMVSWSVEVSSITSKLYGRLTGGAKANNLTAVLTFIDVSKAFDFVSGTTMVKILYAAYVGMLTDREREINLF